MLTLYRICSISLPPQILQKIREREWGLLILDEVHVVAATDFRKVFKVVAAHCKLGLTGTLAGDVIHPSNSLCVFPVAARSQ